MMLVTTDSDVMGLGKHLRKSTGELSGQREHWRRQDLTCIASRMKRSRKSSETWSKTDQRTSTDFSNCYGRQVLSLKGWSLCLGHLKASKRPTRPLHRTTGAAGEGHPVRRRASVFSI